LACLNWHWGFKHGLYRHTILECENVQLGVVQSAPLRHSVGCRNGQRGFVQLGKNLQSTSCFMCCAFCAGLGCRPLHLLLAHVMPKEQVSVKSTVVPGGAAGDWCAKPQFAFVQERLKRHRVSKRLLFAGSPSISMVVSAAEFG